MITLNRGEWSELYCVLFLLIKPKLEIVNENLETITSELFEIKRIIAETCFPLEYEVVNNRIAVYVSKEKVNDYSQNEIEKYKNLLYERITNVTSRSGSFAIEEIDEFLNDFALGQVLKAGSGHKEDIEVLANDMQKNVQCKLKYSIKSSLGSPATLLNASNHTNFKYKIEGMNDTLMNKINSIRTRTKLVDRVKCIYDNNCNIQFESVISDNFATNLKMIDSQMDKYIGNTLLYSYRQNNKILKDIFIEANAFEDMNFSYKKLGDFLLAISFGFFPGQIWDGEYIVNGGIILVNEDGRVLILDLIYHSVSVKKYLVDNTQLDSPSSSRYHMLDIYKENGNYYFNLNLQVRYVRNKN